MAKYIYRCPNCKKEREVQHPIKECDTHREICECGKEMGRKPTPFVFGWSSWDRLLDVMDDNYRKARAKSESRNKQRRKT